ncbi:hypothetical protein JCM5353_005826 [Sporobolomyces roseus]
MSTSSETALGRFLTASGGQFHSALFPKQDSFGTSIYTSQSLPPSTSVVSCPFSLCVTPTLARQSIPTSLFSTPSEDNELLSTRKHRYPNHELLALYLILHLLPATLLSSFPNLDLQHQPYVDYLPSPDSMQTTLYFTPQERSLLVGSNLHGATEDRKHGWKQEWEEIFGWVRDERVKKEVTWERWLWACTIISSRAFPSHLLDSDKTNSTPVLFPGIDMLNHKPTAKLTWSSDVHVVITRTAPDGKDGKGMLSIVIDEEVPADSQVFNTYGAKSNEELLLGYGFVLSTPNPADCVALKLSLPPNCSPALFDLLHTLKLEGMRHFVGRNGELPKELQAQMRLLLSPPEEIQELSDKVEETKESGKEIRWEEFVGFLGWETELDMLDSLEGMLGSKMMALQAVDTSQGGEGVRENVREMIQVYRQGQIDILEKAIEFRDKLMEETMQRAAEDGVELDFEGEEDDDEE